MSENERPPSSRGGLLVLTGVLGVGAVIAAFLRSGTGESDTQDVPIGGAGGTSPSGSASAGVDVRCHLIDVPPSVVLGEPPKVTADPDAGVEADPFNIEDVDQFAPFAVIAGRGISHGAGFALGALLDEDGGTVARIVTVDDQAKAGVSVRLTRSRGDLEAPVVASDGKSLFFAFLEPDAGGRTLRVGRVDGETPKWGLELPQGVDESLAVDLAVSAKSGLVVWDDAPKGDAGSRIFLVPFDPVTLKSDGDARPITRKETNAETPRLVRREGGYWLTYVVRGAESPKGRDPQEQEETVDDDEVDERRGGESIAFSWIELLPLDDAGTAAGAPIAVTSHKGHVVAYDVAAGSGDQVRLAWRDERSPSGSAGGTIYLQEVGMGGASEPILLQDEGVGSGVPDLLGSRIAVTPLSGPVLIANLTADGDIQGAFSAEPSIGRAEPLAASGSKLLLGRPAGKALRLEIVECK